MGEIASDIGIGTMFGGLYNAGKATGVTSPLTDAIGLTKPKGTPGPSSPDLSLTKQQGAADKERADERRRRQLIAAQNRLTKTSSLGASLKDMPLGGGNVIQGS